MTAARFTSPVGHDHPKPAMSPAKLEAAIATARARVEAHKASRPGHTDIPALTAWAQAHDLLRFDLELLLGQRPARDVPTPTIPPPARPAPTMEIPVNEHELIRRLLATPAAFWAGFGILMWAFIRIFPPPARPRPMVIPPARPDYLGIHLPPIVLGLGVAATLAGYLYVLFGSDDFTGAEP